MGQSDNGETKEVDVPKEIREFMREIFMPAEDFPLFYNPDDHTIITGKSSDGMRNLGDSA